MSEQRVLCRLDEIPENASRGFAADATAYYADVFVIRAPDGLYAYRNRCPHTGAPMEREPQQFLDDRRTLIQCGLHGALFRIRDGYCISGPCQGMALGKITITVRDGMVVALEKLEEPSERDSDHPGR